MSNQPHPFSGRVGWLCAALLFGVLAGGGIAWLLINRPPASPAVVYYPMMPTPAPSATPPPEDPEREAQNTKRRHRAVRPAGDLPPVLQTALAVTPAPELSAGLDGSNAASGSPASTPEPGRQTVLVDGVAITQPTAAGAATPRPTAPVLYGSSSALVDDSLTFALDGIQQYIKAKFSLREDVWGGELVPGSPRAISHQLFKGNDYWFSMGSCAAGSTIRVRLYDSEGHFADTNYWQQEARDGSYAAAEIQCQRTGVYFIVVSVEKTPEGRTPWGLVYAYR